MISLEQLAKQTYLAWQEEFRIATGETTVAWESMSSHMKAAWIAAAKQCRATLATVH
jgi:hypothetical protein